jgi:hypothetical protein
MDPSAGWCAYEAWLHQEVDGMLHWFVISCMKPLGHKGRHAFKWDTGQWQREDEHHG